MKQYQHKCLKQFRLEAGEMTLRMSYLRSRVQIINISAYKTKATKDKTKNEWAELESVVKSICSCK